MVIFLPLEILGNNNINVQLCLLQQSGAKSILLYSELDVVEQHIVDYLEHIIPNIVFIQLEKL